MEFPRVALGTIAIIILICVILGVARGDFQLLSNEPRFAGLYHPNTTARHLAVGILAGLVVSSHAAGVRRGCCILLLILFGILLFQTGSRTSILALLAGVIAITLLASLVSKRTGFWFLFWVVGSLACLTAYVVTGGELPELATSAVTMGRERADLSTLTGRIPAWQVLISRFVSDRPLIGYGYGAFWTPDHIITMSFVVPGFWFFHAHSGYIDLVLGVGFVGAVLYLSAVLGALMVLSVGFVRSRDPGLLFMVGLLVMLLTGMLTESMTFHPSLPTFFTQIALANAAFVRHYRSPPNFPEGECESV
jgi:O-antigen ligase